MQDEFYLLLWAFSKIYNFAWLIFLKLKQLNERYLLLNLDN